MKQALILMHVPFDGPSIIKQWLDDKGISFEELPAWEIENWDALELPDWLIIMGGPMSADDDKHFPWLASEAAFIQRAIDANCKVLGICLGAQLIARTFGGCIRRQSETEIGWHAVFPTAAGRQHPIGQLMGASPRVMHWHSDSASLPPNATLLASSQACREQIFTVGENVLALQCHLEMVRPQVERLAFLCASQLENGGEYIQPKDSLLSPDAPFGTSHALLGRMLDTFAAQ